MKGLTSHIVVVDCSGLGREMRGGRKENDPLHKSTRNKDMCHADIRPQKRASTALAITAGRSGLLLRNPHHLSVNDSLSHIHVREGEEFTRSPCGHVNVSETDEGNYLGGPRMSTSTVWYSLDSTRLYEGENCI